MRRALLILLATTAAAHAQALPTIKGVNIPPQVQQTCASTAATPLPADIANAPTRAQFPLCGSYALYNSGKFAEARSCAIAERAAILHNAPGSPDSTRDGTASAGATVVLAQLYANGESVPQSSALATRFLCEGMFTGEVYADDTDSLKSLQTISNLHPGAPRILLCDFEQGAPTSGMPLTRGCEERGEEVHAEMHAGGIQGGIDAAQKDADDADAAIAPLLKSFTAAQKAAYDRAAAAMQRFIDADVTGDTLYMGGYGSGGLYPNEEHAAFENRVITAVQSPPTAPAPKAVAQSDATLNDLYRKLHDLAAQVQAVPPDTRNDRNITANALRDEQRAWLAYRDSFVALGRTLHPNVPADAWLLLITQGRVDDLKQISDLLLSEWTDEIARYKGWKAAATVSSNNRTMDDRSRVADVLDHLTPPQQAAWQHVQTTLNNFVAAHNATVPFPAPSYADQQWQKLYGELYAIHYNQTHGFAVDNAKAAAAYAKNDAALNAQYQQDLATPCIFQPIPGEQSGVHRTPEGLRAEQRAWIPFRDAWVAFLQTVYPNQSRESLANMFIGSRTFELEMLHTICERSGQPPREQ